MKKENQNIDRRTFLKRFGTGATVTTLAIAGCDSGKNQVVNANASAAPVLEKGKMTYRTNPKTGEKVSLLGYGCMRWPTLHDADETLDQETINQLVDKALEYGVNYFDTSPAYCKGLSERATGIALSRHPRDSYYCMA